MDLFNGMNILYSYSVKCEQLGTYMIKLLLKKISRRNIYWNNNILVSKLWENNIIRHGFLKLYNLVPD